MDRFIFALFLTWQFGENPSSWTTPDGDVISWEHKEPMYLSRVYLNGKELDWEETRNVFKKYFGTDENYATFEYIRGLFETEYYEQYGYEMNEDEMNEE